MSAQIVDSVLRTPWRLLNSSFTNRTTVRTYRRHRAYRDHSHKNKPPPACTPAEAAPRERTHQHRASRDHSYKKNAEAAPRVGLHNKIIENTLCGGTDQGHFTTIHVSRSREVQDRTRYLIGQSDVNPGVAMAEAVYQTIVAVAQANEETAIVTVPCNTFHAPPIWDRYCEHMNLLGADSNCIVPVHMLNETVQMIKEIAPAAQSVGVLSTTGARHCGVYRTLLEKEGYEMHEVSEHQQAGLHESIYNPEWGIKAVSPITEQAVEAMRKYAQQLVRTGADVIILGCTEIPLALPEAYYSGVSPLSIVPLIDPVEAAARAMIKMADPAKLLRRGGRMQPQVLYHRVTSMDMP